MASNAVAWLVDTRYHEAVLPSAGFELS